MIMKDETDSRWTVWFIRACSTVALVHADEGRDLQLMVALVHLRLEHRRIHPMLLVLLYPHLHILHLNMVEDDETPEHTPGGHGESDAADFDEMRLSEARLHRGANSRCNQCLGNPKIATESFVADD